MAYSRNMSKVRLTNLDALRGLAALAVCLYHFDPNGLIGISFLSAIFRHGHLGVDVFFVISGFVIPLSLHRTGYGIADWRGFLVSRFFRLYPAYFAAGVAAIGIEYLAAQAPGFPGDSPFFSNSQILSNLFLLCDFTGEGWVIGVFWTLAIEAQYCVLIAVTFSFISSSNSLLRRMTLATWIIAPLIAGNGPTVFSWTALFAVGIVAYLRKEKKIESVEFIIVTLAAVAVQIVAKSWLSGSFGAVTALAILFLPNLRLKGFLWIGAVSYSLYLIHLPFGGRVMNLAQRLPEIAWIRLLAAGVALGLSLVMAAALYRLIEMPSHAFARNARRQILSRRSSQTDRTEP